MSVCGLAGFDIINMALTRVNLMSPCCSYFSEYLVTHSQGDSDLRQQQQQQKRGEISRLCEVMFELDTAALVIYFISQV